MALKMMTNAHYLVQKIFKIYYFFTTTNLNVEFTELWQRQTIIMNNMLVWSTKTNINIIFFGHVHHVNVHWCEFFGHVHKFCSYSFGHLFQSCEYSL